MHWRVTPRFGAGERDEEFTISPLRAAIAVTTDTRVVTLHAFDAGDAQHTQDEISGCFTTSAGSAAALVLRATHDEPIPVARREWIERRIDDTAADWERWLADAGIDGWWRDATRRSALALRLLTYVPTGAIVAAPTTSLPERIGGDKNYDYRYMWVRDSAYTLDVFMRLGLPEQVHESFCCLLRAIGSTAPELRPFYSVEGTEAKRREELPLRGYRNSQPVRYGNGAGSQLQLGTWGDLLETTSLYLEHGNALDSGT